MSITMSTIQIDFLDKIKESWSNDTQLQSLIQNLSVGQADPNYQWTQNLLYRKGKLVVGNDLSLQQHIIHLFHHSPLGGHSWVVVTKKKVGIRFYWKGLGKAVRNFVRPCDVCQRNKADLGTPTGLLQLLSIPGAVRVDISLDFIERLPKSRGKDTILVVMDRLSKYADFLPMCHTSTVASMAQLHFEQIFRLHGLPRTIVSDRDKIFPSTSWRALFTL